MATGPTIAGRTYRGGHEDADRSEAAGNDGMRVAAEVLQARIARLFAAEGLPTAASARLAEALVDANGRAFHRAA